MTTDKNHDDLIAQANTLSEALPYMRRYSGQTLVIKYGGHAMVDDELARQFARDIVLLKQVGMNPVVVHGGGPQIAAMLDRLNIESEFVDGLRVTDEATVEVVEMVLVGSINKRIVSAINEAGGQSIGLSGKDANLIRAERHRTTRRDPETGKETVLDLGLVGKPTEIGPHILELLKGTDIVPVIAPVGVSPDGETLNINSDTVAGAVAAAIAARRMILLTDVAGVLDAEGNLIAEMTADEARARIADGTVNGGMIPKVETCLEAVEGGVPGAVIIDGRVPHALLLEIFTEHGAGTLIRGD